MITTPRMKELYQSLQKKLFDMIPEKWDKLYLYASVTTGIHQLETGEMFFYYFPKGLLKKEPINVYEVPNKFNIDEKEYFRLADELYGVIKRARQEFAKSNDKLWSNVTISIENCKFKVEYSYEDLKNSPYSSYDRHMIWRYEYLQTNLERYSRKERTMILEYIENQKYVDEKKDTYIEGIYETKGHNMIGYDRQEQEILEINQEAEEKPEEIEKAQKNQILNFNIK